MIVTQRVSWNMDACCRRKSHDSAGAEHDHYAIAVLKHEICTVDLLLSFQTLAHLADTGISSQSCSNYALYF